MPVTVRVAQHDARPWPAGWQPPTAAASSSPPLTSQSVLTTLNHKKQDEIGAILQTALGPQTSLPDARLQDMRLRVQDHGLVRAALEAYNYHHHLVLRPEDVWFAVLTQFSFFVNAHAEELRSVFVAHEGKKGLVLSDPGQPDMGLMCRNMTKLIDANVVDPELRAWIMPAFSTTTMHDEVVASVIMMGTLQKYFDYVFDCSCCGIPTVTLLGERSDWEDIQRRIEKLSEYGEEPSQFLALLRPVLRHMVATFARPPGDTGVADFWSRIIRHDSGSGMSSLTGWMVAFCFWDEDGKCFYQNHDGRYEYIAKLDPHRKLDEAVYHEVDFNQVPAGFVSVPVTYITPDQIQINTMLLAGFVGFEATAAVNHPWNGGGKPKKSEKSNCSPETKQVSTFRALLSSAGKKLTKLCDSESRLKPTIEDSKNLEKASAPSNKSTPDRKVTSNNQILDTLRPVTGWWMYKVKDSKNSGISRDEFYKTKMAGDWSGQVSTGYVSHKRSTVEGSVEDADGQVRIDGEEGRAGSSRC